MSELKKCCDCDCKLTKHNTSYADFVCDACYEAEQAEQDDDYQEEE